MKNYFFKILVFCFILSAPLVSANNTFVQAFLENAPLRQIKIEVDGVIIGVTDGNGVVEAEIGTGEQKLYLIDDETEIPVFFSLSSDDEVEISIVYSRDPNKAPIVNTQIFGADSSATGFLAGIVTSPTGIPIPNAKININDTELTTTNKDGTYSLELPRGPHNVSVYLDGYSSSEINNIRVMADLGSYAGFKLFKKSKVEDDNTASKSFEEVVTLGVFNPTDGAENIERYATTVVSAIDSEQLSRFGDSDVADAITRMVGLSINEGKYANVRGLDGRYIATTFNKILMPSTDPMRRDVQLDLFPSNIVEKIEVQKSFSPDQPATTTGGSLSVHTKGIPDEKVSSFSVSIGTNSLGGMAQSNSGSSHDWKGYDDGKRSLPAGALELTGGQPDITDGGKSLDSYTIIGGKERCFASSGFCATDLERRMFTRSFDHDYSISHIDKSLKEGFSASSGNRLNLDAGDLGYYFAGSYEKGTSNRGDAYLMDPAGAQGAYERTKGNVSFNLYGAIGYENDYGETLLKSTLLRSTDNLIKHSIYLDDVKFFNNATIEYVERQLVANSLNGSYLFEMSEFSAELDWRLGESETTRDEPGRKKYESESYGGGDFQLIPGSVEQRWSDLDEKSMDGGFDLKLSREFGENYLTLKLGMLNSEKSRSLYLYRFGFLPPSYQDLYINDVSLDVANGFYDEDYMDANDNIIIDDLLPDLSEAVRFDSDLESIISQENMYNDTFIMTGKTDTTDTYFSDENINSKYLTINAEISDIAVIEGGWRFEEFEQILTYPKSSQSNEVNGTPLLKSNYYPALNLTYFANEITQLRLGYSETVSYPGLIERSESVSYDPDTDKKIIGNSLLLASDIENYDLRIESYFDNGNRLSLALFHKDISNPIERSVGDGSGSAVTGITFRNSDNAIIKGVELDLVTTLVDTDLHHVFLNANWSKINSEVELDDDSTRLEGITSRPLQGQSELLANIQLGYDHYPSRQKFTFLVNYFDDRIHQVSRGAAFGSVIENGRIKFDLNYEKNFSESWNLKLKAKNITNEPISYSQNDRVIEIYESGASVSASLTYDF
ncbi:MAG: TonB-dependent receptor [Cellvibrionales bacterium TMED47]|nr:hypothetical protein [Porticoccaceae bacterium]RPG84805.1 MAG: TonB-dependent receptor [Cellvibrionales bacterium TMED47]